ncbi:ABC transporter ATP-binding protein/permease [Nocardia sp. Root136]|uniref:ABC transporter ATP-binding protein/permease n=1 Tax=Nocardia sp. Root136 TaxID=1736458 RepID=UPI0012E706E7|nr:ATP-binding cassette domain-containing protein [Nocardia sp. Root136]
MSRWWRYSMAGGVGLVVLLAVAGPLFAPHPGEKAVGMPFAQPGGDALLGTDRLGRDVLSHLLTGGTQLLAVSAVIAVAVTVLSAVLGAVAAVRPRAGKVIELCGDLVILLPAVLGILLVLTAWPQGGVTALVAVSLLFGVPYCARIFAASASTIAASGYVESAVASGESLSHLVFREILPNLRAVFTTQLGLRFVVAVYLVSTIAFLGVSALDPDNWAIMVRDNASGLLLNPWAVLAPSTAIAIVAVGVNLVVTSGPRNRRTAKTSDALDAVEVSRPRAERGALSGGALGGVNVAGGSGDAGRLRDSGRAGVCGISVVDSGDAAVVDGLSVVADSGAVLLAPVSFRLTSGTVTALTGASGSGKSTAMRALLGHLPAGASRQGAVLVAGHDVFALDAGALRAFRRGQIAYVGQDPGSELNPLLRVRAVLAEAAPGASAADRLAVLEQVGLDPAHLRRRCARLSGGQQRRVALARAILRRPRILVLDEPLAGLHGTLRTEIAQLISTLATENHTTVLLSGHDTEAITAIADTVIELHPPGDRSMNVAVAVADSVEDARLSARSSVRASVSGTDRIADMRTDLSGEVPGSRTASRTGPAEIALRTKAIHADAGGHRVLENIGFSLPAGAALAVVGPSGAGKTTLARVIAGLHADAIGSLEVDGVRVPVGSRRRIRFGANGIQFVPQNPRAALNPRRTVEQTLARPLRRIARVPRPEIHPRVTALLAAVDLPADLADRRPHQLSGGQRQRVALARALAADPAVLICDEITTALDTDTAAAIMSLLDRLRADHGTAVILISHDMTLVRGHCTDLLVLDHGRIVESGTPETVLTTPTHRATAALLG